MNELIQFSHDTENGETNYNLAVWYENEGHTAPAHSYYLRAAERTEDNILAYKALIRASLCYKKQGSRDGTEKVLLENALMLLPERPEAYYFLSILYEKKGEWQNCYIYANLGLQQYNKVISSIDLLEYSGKYLLIFQKAVAAWWWGKGQQCRDLFKTLIDNYWECLDEKHKLLVEDNISKLGITKDSQSQVLYNKLNHDFLRYKFNESEKIESNYSQVFQDMFVLSMLNGKRNGTFLEIGGATPYERNNTALLEEKFNWTGLSIELNDAFVSQYKAERPTTKIVHADALSIDYNKLLSENFTSNSIDYLQLDIEPAKNTYECMLKIPFDEYKFAVITYEHDYYVDVTRSYREKSREFLSNKGYILIANDISPDGKSNFEDWWVHPDLIDSKIINVMKSVSNNTQHVKEYMLMKKNEVQ